jgi:hypothetical protein
MRRIPRWCSSVWTTAVLVAAIAVCLVIILTHLGTPATGNLAACQQYKTQRAWAFGVGGLDPADIKQLEAYLRADAGQSTGTLHAALATMVYDLDTGLSSLAPSETVLAECEALGVTFPPEP